MRGVPRDPAADALLADHPDNVVRTAQRLRDVLLDAHPELTEGARSGWHALNYRHPEAGFVCALFPGDDRVDLVFEHGAALPDPDRRLTGDGRQVRTLPFPAGAEIDGAPVVEFLDLAVEFGAARRARRWGPPRTRGCRRSLPRRAWRARCPGRVRCRPARRRPGRCRSPRAGRPACRRPPGRPAPRAPRRAGSSRSSRHPPSVGNRHLSCPSPPDRNRRRRPVGPLCHGAPMEGQPGTVAIAGLLSRVPAVPCETSAPPGRPRSGASGRRPAASAEQTRKGLAMERTEERASVLAMRQLVDDAWLRRLDVQQPPRPWPRGTVRSERPRPRTRRSAPATRWWTGDENASVLF
jgi:hypothetical protein